MTDLELEELEAEGFKALIDARDKGQIAPWEIYGGALGKTRHIRTLGVGSEDVLMMVEGRSGLAQWSIMSPLYDEEKTGREESPLASGWIKEPYALNLAMAEADKWLSELA